MKKQHPITKKERNLKYTDHQKNVRENLGNEAVVIVTGAQGALAQEYLKTFSKLLDKKRVVGLHRRKLTGDEQIPKDDITYIQADLKDQNILNKIFSELHLDKYERMIVIHTVGKFKHELKGKPEIDNDNDGIDDEVRESNVDLTKQLVESIDEILSKSKIENKKPSCKFVAFGSIVENEYARHPDELKHLRSFCIAKQEMRDYLHEVNKEKSHILTTIFKLPTLDTEQERKLRPNAEHTKDWLTPEIIVAHTLPEIAKNTDRREKAECSEIDIYPRRHLTEEQKQNYIKEHLNRWIRETGYSAGPNESNFEFRSPK